MALPSARETVLDGWIARWSGGMTRRTNSVNPVEGPRADIITMLDRAREIYAALGQPLIIRVPTLVSGIDSVFDGHGFGPAEAETVTLYANLTECLVADFADTEVGACDEQWLRARGRLAGSDAATMHAYRTSLDCIAAPAVFAATRRGGRIVTVAYGVVFAGMLVVESVVTDTEARRHGFARQAVSALLAWAVRQGASEACLQVVAGNAPAAALYRRLGFTTTLYSYHYRRELPGYS